MACSIRLLNTWGRWESTGLATRPTLIHVWFFVQRRSQDFRPREATKNVEGANFCGHDGTHYYNKQIPFLWQRRENVPILYIYFFEFYCCVMYSGVEYVVCCYSECISHTRQAEKSAWPRWESNPRPLVGIQRSRVRFPPWSGWFFSLPGVGYTLRVTTHYIFIFLLKLIIFLKKDFPRRKTQAPRPPS